MTQGTSDHIMRMELMAGQSLKARQSEQSAKEPSNERRANRRKARWE